MHSMWMNKDSSNHQLVRKTFAQWLNHMNDELSGQTMMMLVDMGSRVMHRDFFEKENTFEDVQSSTFFWTVELH